MAVVVVWVVVWAFTRGSHTLDLPDLSRTALHDRLTEIQNSLLASRSTNPVMQLTNAIADAFRSTVDWLQRLVSKPASRGRCRRSAGSASSRSRPTSGCVVASWRIALLVLASFLSFGVLGFWDESMDRSSWC